MTTLVFVHGAWGCPEDWGDVIEEIGGRAHCVTADLPSVRRADATLADDAAYVRKLIADEQDVVLVAHSYGGMVITEVGDAPNVRHLVYVASVAPDKDETLYGLASADADPGADGNLEIRDDGTSVINDFAEGEPYLVYTADARARMGRRPRRPASIASAISPCTETAWRTVPSTFIVALRDTTLVADLQRRHAERAGATTVHELDWPHFVINEAPLEIAEIVLGVSLG
jgi:pimeloyl-ACP methyl ester carboxylesterase